MRFANLFKDAGNDAIGSDYDAIEPAVVQTNLLVMTESKERQAVIKKMRVGSLVSLNRTRRNGQTVYVVKDMKTDKTIGEISYGSSDYLDQNYRNYKTLGKVTEIGKITPMGHGIQVRIEYKVYL